MPRPPDEPIEYEIRVAGVLDDIPVRGTLPAGATFTGLLDVTELELEDGKLLVSGVLTGAIRLGPTTIPVTQTFTDVPVTLESSPGRSCRTMTLDLGPITLPGGMTIDLTALEMDFTGDPGPNNRLRNLLCKAFRMLDTPGNRGH